jgi:hypothetical protein
MSVRKSLQRAENELEKKSSEVLLLSQRLEILSSYVKEKQSGAEEANDKIENVSKRLEAQMLELRRKDGPNPEMRKQMTGSSPLSASKAHRGGALKAQCSLLEEENREMRALLLRGDGKKQSAANDGGRDLESYIKQLEQDSDSALLQQVSLFIDRPLSPSLLAPGSGGQKCVTHFKVKPPPSLRPSLSSKIVGIPVLMKS